MPVTIALGGSPSIYWYLTRATGAVALLLLSVTLALGVINVRRLKGRSLPRFLLSDMHRYSSLLAVVFVALHVLTTVLDGFAPVSLIAAVAPFTSSYRPLWLSLGSVAFDLLLALIMTSLLAGRLSHRAWRATHWLAYACWPLALVHALGTGSDARLSWFLLIALLCVALVALAVLARVLSTPRLPASARAGALGALTAFLLFLVIWLPSGPLASNWARRAGTPAALLGHPK
ncbi:MAG TPA: ferric reductase-like transmembrane domain-containing protein [Solirubrobacteraceae bacterium]|nr:ferric reductase-like transmembrane domain-containing protein [Solirubrobacteraceae bacterium]